MFLCGDFFFFDVLLMMLTKIGDSRPAVDPVAQVITITADSPPFA
jgi:hypothetical protein